MNNITLKFSGPYSMVGKKTIFDAIEFGSHGLYFFTFKINSKFVIEYVGMTKRSFRERFLEHMRELLSGGYSLYNFNDLERGKYSKTWSGRFGKDHEKPEIFYSHYKHISKYIERQLNEYQMFLVPLDIENRLIERIEASIYKLLRGGKDKLVINFLEGIKTRGRIDNENPIVVKIKANDLSHYLSETLEI